MPWGDLHKGRYVVPRVSQRAMPYEKSVKGHRSAKHKTNCPPDDTL